jgi:hypothetical protein
MSGVGEPTRLGESRTIAAVLFPVERFTNWHDHTDPRPAHGGPVPLRLLLSDRSGMISQVKEKPVQYYPARVHGSGAGFTVEIPGIGSGRCTHLEAAEQTARDLISDTTGQQPDEFGVAVVRSMAVGEFARTQVQGHMERHVAPINAFVEQLRLQKPELHVPWVAPFHGGVDARLLMLLRDPGPMADADKGSGFLCAQNDDPSAENHTVLFARAGINPRDVLPWNSYPWYVNRAATGKDELAEGVAALRELLDLLPQLEIVMLAGVQARQSWNMLEQHHGGYLEKRGISVVWTYHPSRQALRHPDPLVQQWRRDHQLWTAVEIAGLLTDGNGRQGHRYVRTVEPPPNLLPLGNGPPARSHPTNCVKAAAGTPTEAPVPATTREKGIAALRARVVAAGGSLDETVLGRRSEVRIKAPNGAVVTGRVSTRSGGTWQTSSKYGDDAAEEDPNRVWIFVDLVPSTAGFYIAPEWLLQRDIADVHDQYLANHGGTRPKSDKSNTHHAIALNRVTQWSERWDLLELRYVL